MQLIDEILENTAAVLFDLDGTLADSMWVWSEIDREFFRSRGMDFPDFLNKAIEGMSFSETAQYFVNTFQLSETTEELKAIWNDMAMEKYCTAVPLKPGARQFLATLRERGIAIGIATSNSRLLVDAFLQIQGLTDCIDAVTTSCDVQQGKPSPEVYLTTAEKLGVAPEQCLVFEDIPMGILAGKNAGMRVVAIEDEYSAQQHEEKRRLADWFIRDYDQLFVDITRTGIHQ